MAATPDTGAYWHIVNVEVALAWEGRYLLLIRGESESHAAGLLSPPGGKVEGSGTVDNILEETARREVKEETNLEIGERLIYLESHTFVVDGPPPAPVVDVVFLAVPTSNSGVEIDETEAAGYRWLAAEEIEAESTAPLWTRQTIRLAERRRLELGW